MTHMEFDSFLSKFFDDLKKIGDTKGLEYSNSGDRLANFKRLAMKLGTTPETVCLIYGTKHLDSIDHFVKYLDMERQVPFALRSEPIQGRFHDAVLYLILLAALIEERTSEALGLEGGTR